MSRSWPCVLLVCALALGPPLATVAEGGWGHLLPRRDVDAGPPAYQSSLQGVSVGPPGPHRYPEYNTGCYPWYGYGFGVPTYNWGYFGAHYRPFSVSHTGYYNDFVQWGYRRGY